MLANNNSKIPEKDLREIRSAIISNYFFILSQWKMITQVEEIKFYC